MKRKIPCSNWYELGMHWKRKHFSPNYAASELQRPSVNSPYCPAYIAANVKCAGNSFGSVNFPRIFAMQ